VRVEIVREIYSLPCEEPSLEIQLRLDFKDGYSRTITIPENGLHEVKWLDLDIHCWFEPAIPISKFPVLFLNEIKAQANRALRHKIYRVGHVGVTKIEGTAVFCTGREIIRSPDSNRDLNIEVEKMPLHLDIDETLPETQAVSKMLDLISLSPDPGRIILAGKLVCLMRQAYIDVGRTPNVCVYLYGQTGTHKTTFAGFLTQTYNRGQGIKSPTRLDASIAASVRILSEAYDDIVVFDDLCPAESVSIRKQQEETCIEIARYVADGTVPAKMRGQKLALDSPKCGVLFTGEYLIGSGSDAARLLPVEMTKPDGEELKYFQDHPLIVSTFYFYFLQWFVAHYDEIVLLLAEWWSEYCKIDLGVHARLQETHFFLESAYAVFMQYCWEKELLSEQEVAKLHDAFQNLLTVLVDRQNIRVCKNEKSTAEFNGSDYLERIRTLYRGREISIAESEKQFDEKIHDGVLHRNALYLRRDALIKFFPKTDLSKIIEALISQKVLECGKRGTTKQISSLHGKRFYVIPLVYLE
jgi:hypothetical protein